MHLAALQYDIAWENPTESRRRMAALLDRAALPAGSAVVLPELGDVGFTLNVAGVTPSSLPAWAAAEAKARGIYVAAGYPALGPDGMGRNECVVARPDGTLATPYAKVHPFGVGRETEAYRGGTRLSLVRVGDFTACPLICYDLRFPELWRLAMRAGANLFLIGASWPAARQHHWRSLLIARAIENQAYVVASNRTGNDPSLAYAGGSMIIAPTGDVLAEGGASDAVITADADRATLDAWRQKFPALADCRAAHLGAIDVDRS
jgi:omega-amidase